MQTDPEQQAAPETPAAPEQEKGILDNLGDALGSLGAAIGQMVDQVEEAVEEKYEELKQNETVGAFIHKAEDAIEGLKDKAEALKDQLMGEDSTEAEKPAEPQQPAE
ncbi:MAG: hypothetical protein NW241_15305 [Bacteroidia bacterium]|nr:hypothetical protein [Bacteroidia bacterium]